MILYYILLCLGIYFVSILYLSTRKPKNFPPGPKWYPIVGSLPQLKKLIKSTEDIVTAYDMLSKQYNSEVIGLKLGSQKVVIVLSPAIVKQIFLDDNYLGRPDNFFFRLRTFGTSRGITSNSGKMWAVQRNFVVKHLRNIGYGKEITEMKIRSEISEAMKLIEENPLDVDFRELLSFSIVNVLWTLVSGSPISRDDVIMEGLLNLLHKRIVTFDISGNTLNYFPWLRFFAPEILGYNLIKKLNRQLKEFLSEIIENHISTWREGRNDDLIYAYISEINNTNATKNQYLNYEELQIVCLDLFFPGITVASISLDFAFFAMAIHQDVQTKVQKIFDETFDRKMPLQYSDRKKVPYIEAVFCEILRYYVIIPINAPRAPKQDVVLNGYVIPKGTSVFQSFHSVFTNPECFEEPDVFRPERFLNSNEEFISHESFFPFGLGNYQYCNAFKQMNANDCSRKRKCLGDVLAKMSQFLFFGEIIRKYKIYPMYEVPTKGESFNSGIFRTRRNCPIRLIKRF